MPDRLTALEQTALAQDTPRTPSTVGTVAVFETPPSGFGIERLTALVADRIRYVPRYRQRVLGVPGRLADPVWVDDSHFDLSFHVRRATLPSPGTQQQLGEFAERVLARRLDRSRPLWELYLVDGLETDRSGGERFALVAKTHPCVVDGIDTVDLLQVLLDTEPDDSLGPEEDWQPLPAPGPMELVAEAVTESLREPGRIVSNLQHAVTEAFGAAAAAGEAVGLGTSIGDLAADAIPDSRPPHRTPLAGSVSDHRRSAVLSVELDDLRAIGADHQHTVNDVLLTMITSGLRAWLMTRGENLDQQAAVSALVPMSVVCDDDQTSLGSAVEPYGVELPIGEPAGSAQRDRIAEQFQAHKESGRMVSARELSLIAGFAAATLQALGVRTGSDPHRPPYDLMIINAPGPQIPVYLGRSRMTQCYPVVPLSAGRLLAVGVTSYDGTVSISLNADRRGLDDLDVLTRCFQGELTALLDATSTGSSRTVSGGDGRRSARREARRAATRHSAAKITRRSAGATVRRAANRANRRSEHQSVSDRARHQTGNPGPDNNPWQEGDRS